MRTDLSSGLKPKLGQTQSAARFLERQAEHADAHPDAEFDFQILENNVPKGQLDRHEQFYINGYGGPTLPSGRSVGELSNARNQMSWLRYALAGEDSGIP